MSLSTPDGATRDDPSYDDIAFPEQLAAEHPDKLSESQLRWLIKQRQHNGLKESGAVLKVGRRIYLNKRRFLKWLLSQKT